MHTIPLGCPTSSSTEIGLLSAEDLAATLDWLPSSTSPD